MQIDMRVLELLSSKICHDLVSPVSAINNGVELIEDIGGSVVDEAMKLIGDSAGHASRRLRLFRMAYGRAGSDEQISVKEVRQTASQYLSSGKTMLNWPDDQPSYAVAELRGFLKTLLNMIILSEEVLAYGGVATIRGLAESEGFGCRLEIVGRGAALSDACKGALERTTPVEEVTPRNVQAYVTASFAANFNLTIKFEQPMPDRLDLIVTGVVPKPVAAESAIPTDPPLA